MEPAKKERAHLVQVVGYDGTEPATRALNAAALWLQGVPGHLEVVFVAHIPASVMASAGGAAAVREGFDSEELELASASRRDVGTTPCQMAFSTQKRRDCA
jgi:hypothetical protein